MTDSKVEIDTQITIKITNKDGSITTLIVDEMEARKIYAELKNIFDRGYTGYIPYPIYYPPYRLNPYYPTYPDPYWYTTTGTTTPGTTFTTTGDNS